METGVVGALSAMLVAGGALAQPMDIIASQLPTPGVASETSQRATGGQTIEPARELIEDFVAISSGTLRAVRLYAEPTSNVYAIRLRVLELDASDAIADEIALAIAGISRLQSDTAPGGDGLVAYDVSLDGGVSIEQGKRYGIEAVGLLTSPTMGDVTRAWRWAGAEGNGDVLVHAGDGLESLDLPGLAFEALGDVDAPDCLADVNDDGRLTPNDFNAWVLAFNAQDPRADQNGDGQIAPNDLNAWLLNYNAGC